MTKGPALPPPCRRLAIAALLALAACAAPVEKPAAPAAPVVVAPPRPEPPPPPVALAGELLLEWGEGPARAVERLRGRPLTCVAQDGLFRLRARDATAKGLSEALLMVRPPVAGRDRFTLHFTVGRPGDKASRSVALRIAGEGESVGTGTVAITDEGEGATVRVDGRTASGIALVLTGRCASVLRLPPKSGETR